MSSCLSKAGMVSIGSCGFPEPQPFRILVEMISHHDMTRLEARDEDVRGDVIRVANRVEGVNRQLQELIQLVGDLRRNVEGRR